MRAFSLIVAVVAAGCALDSGDGGNRSGSGGAGSGAGIDGGGVGGSGGVAGNAGVGGASGAAGFGAIGGIGGMSGGSGGNAGVGMSVDAGGVDVCSLPFEAGDCDASLVVWASVPELGACFPHIYGGCGGNGNRFASRVDCESACPPLGPIGCPPNRVSATICLACGVGGGCAQEVTTCALVCDEFTSCPGTASALCVGGVCQAGGCI